MVDVDAPDLAARREQFVAAQLAGDRRRALALVADIAGQPGVSPADIRRDVIRPAQREIGRMWQHNEITIAQEHAATAISQLALAHLFQRESPPLLNHKRVVVACVDGELHDFPARLVADELELAGFDVRFLGASVPTDHLLSFIAREDPHLVVISATMAFHTDTVRDVVARIRALAPQSAIAVGGQACEWIATLGDDLGVEISGCDAADLVRGARALLHV